MIDEILSSFMQIVIFGLIPFIWWNITSRKEEKFTSWIGLKKVENNKKIGILVLINVVCFMLLGVLILFMIRNVDTATSKYKGLGFKGIPIVIVYALFRTSFSEEILFRGFILKRISNKFGFQVGNIIQSVIFGLLHGTMFINYVGLIKAIVIILFTGIVAYAMGYINEKKANGSILPSWFIHFTTNLGSGILSLFSVL